MTGHDRLVKDNADKGANSQNLDTLGMDVAPSPQWSPEYTDAFYGILSWLDDDEKWATVATLVERSPQGVYDYIDRHSRGIDMLLEGHYAAIEEGRISPDPRLDEIDPPGERRGFKYFYIDRAGDDSIKEGIDERRRGLNGLFELPDGRIVTVTSASNGTMSVGPKSVDIGYPDGTILASVPKSADDHFTTGSRSFVGVKTDLGFVSWDSTNASVFDIEGARRVSSKSFMVRESSDGVQVWMMPPRSVGQILDEEYGGSSWSYESAINLAKSEQELYDRWMARKDSTQESM